MQTIFDPINFPGGLDEPSPPWARWTRCTVASFAALREIADRKEARFFVWPDEGAFEEGGLWAFNEGHQDFEPLLIDMRTAQAACAIHDALSAENKAKVERMVARHRGDFGWFIEFCWSKVRLAPA